MNVGFSYNVVLMGEKSKVAIVGGCGHIGLPLGIVLAEHGFIIYLYDINKNAVDLVNQARMPYLEEEGPERLKTAIESKRLSATLSPEIILSTDVIIFTIGTPIDEHLNSSIKGVLDSLNEVLPYIHSNHTIIFRSTFFPGASQIIFEFLKSKNCRASLAYCPERIMQGKALSEITKIPQIISAFDERGLEKCSHIFKEITGNIITLKPVEAELAKLFCNSWRYINFAISNQFYKIADKFGADFSKIHWAVTKDYSRMKDFAKAGFAAGPCLFKDTMQLSAAAQDSFPLGHQAMLINEGMPALLIDKLKMHLTPLRGRTVSILGMTFKGDSDDIRDALPFKLRKLLEMEGVSVKCHDPFLTSENFPYYNFVELKDALNADACIIGAPHSLYKEINFPENIELIDIWAITRRKMANVR